MTYSKFTTMRISNNRYLKAERKLGFLLAVISVPPSAPSRLGIKQNHKENKMRVSLIGLDVMGYTMAGHLQKPVLTSRF